MQGTVSRWGNSLAVRLSSQLAQEAKLSEGARVDVSVRDGEIVISPARPRYRLSDLLAAHRPEHNHAEVDFGRPEGREVW